MAPKEGTAGSRPPRQNPLDSTLACHHAVKEEMRGGDGPGPKPASTVVSNVAFPQHSPSDHTWGTVKKQQAGARVGVTGGDRQRHKRPVMGWIS